MTYESLPHDYQISITFPLEQHNEESSQEAIAGLWSTQYSHCALSMLGEEAFGWVAGLFVCTQTEHS